LTSIEITASTAASATTWSPPEKSTTRVFSARVHLSKKRLIYTPKKINFKKNNEHFLSKVHWQALRRDPDAAHFHAIPGACRNTGHAEIQQSTHTCHNRCQVYP